MSNSLFSLSKVSSWKPPEGSWPDCRTTILKEKNIISVISFLIWFLLLVSIFNYKFASRHVFDFLGGSAMELKVQIIKKSNLKECKFWSARTHVYLPLPGGYSITSSVLGSSWKIPPLLLFWDTNLLTRVSSARLGGSNSKQEQKERVNRIVNNFILMPLVFVEDWVLLLLKHVLGDVWSLWSSSCVESAIEISILLGISTALFS